MTQDNKDFDKWILSSKSNGCYIFCKSKLLNDLNFIRSNLEKNIILAYSYKTNFYKGLCKTLDELGCLSEVVSPSEVEFTKEYGINPQDIIYNGPNKDFLSIKYVLENNGLVNADSPTDLALIEKVIDVLPDNIYRVGLRLDLGLIEKTRFGFSVNSSYFEKAINIIKNNKKIFFDCLHIHYPSRNLKSLSFRLDSLINLVRSLDDKPKNIDLGGSYTSLLSRDLSEQLNIPKDNLLNSLEIINVFSKKVSLFGIENIILEPGTAISANSFLLCGKVCAINEREDQTIVNLNISKMNLGDINSQINYPFKVFNINKKFETVEGDEVQEKNYLICGNTCIEKDIFYSGRYSKINLGDFIVFEGVGSYSFSFDNNFINTPLKVIDLPFEINF